MGTSRALTYIAAILALTGTLCVAVPPARAGAVILVNTTADPVKPVEDGNCSLREAIEAADTNLMIDQCDGAVSDTIAFSIPGAGEQTITLSDYLLVTTPVTIDGTTQPGYGSTPLIHITRAEAGLIVFQESAEGSVIRGLKFSQGNVGWGHALSLSGRKYEVQACYFGTNGTASLDNYSRGIQLLGSDDSLIGGPAAADRNVFGGAKGITVDWGTGITIQGNYFGVRASDGSAALTGSYGSSDAIQIMPGSTPSNGNTIRGNVIGGYSIGIVLQSPTTSNTIVGNKIGVGANGSTAISNNYGIHIVGSSNNTIGGTSAADRNIITTSAGNFGIYLELRPSSIIPTGNTIRGNYIGTTADGLTGLSPSATGIRIEAGSNTTIGGTAAGAGNVISGNNYGVVVTSGGSGTIIQGNKIGTDPSGTVAVQNHSGIYAGAAVNIGDNTTPGNNVIAGNASAHGIFLHDSSGSTIYGNRIGVGADSTSLPNATGVALLNASVTISGNWIAFNTGDGVDIDYTSSVLASSQNCFTSNAFFAVNNTNISNEAPFTQNWWGRPTGPTHSGNPGGTGDAVSDRVTYTNFLTKAPDACPRTSIDFDGDGKADLGYFHPATGLWGILQSAHSFDYAYPRFFTWGISGDIVTPADYDGDGIWDPTVRRPPGGGQSAAYLMLLSSTDYNYGSTLTVPAGWPGLGDTPVPGDYNGDGISEPAIWRGNTGVWIIPLSPSFNTFQFFSWGLTGDKPIGADVDGDGQTDIGYWRPSTGVWGFLQSSQDYSYASPLFFSWGGSTDIPVMSDYDGDGYSDPAVVIPPAGGQSRAYRILLSSMSYNPASSLTIPAGWPGLGDTPAPADYDGDGMADPAIWRNNTGVWIIPLSSGSYSTYLFRAWGANGDQVVK